MGSPSLALLVGLGAFLMVAFTLVFLTKLIITLVIGYLDRGEVDESEPAPPVVFDPAKHQRVRVTCSYEDPPF